MTPAEELRQAVHLLLNPAWRPAVYGLVGSDLTDPLTDLLETSAKYLDVGEPVTAAHIVRALAVARAINTQE